MWPQIFIKGYKIQVHTIQYQFNTHQHSNEVSPGKEAIHANKE